MPKPGTSGESERSFLIVATHHTTTSECAGTQLQSKLQHPSSSSSSIFQHGHSRPYSSPSTLFLPKRPPLRRSTPKMIVEIIFRNFFGLPNRHKFPKPIFVELHAKKFCHPKLIGGYHVEFSSIRLPKISHHTV